MAAAWFVLAGLFASCGAVNVPLGQPTAVSANAWTNVTYQYLGLVNYQVSVWSDVAADVTFAVYANDTLWGTLNAGGYQALNIGIGLTGSFSSAGYQLTVTNNAQIHAYIVFPVLDASVYGLLVTGVDAGCVQYNSSTQALVRIGTVNYVPSSWTLSVTLPSAGIYLFAAITEVFTVSAQVGASATITAPAMCAQTYQWSVKALSDLWLVFNSSSSTAITVQPLMNTTYSTEGLKPLNIWFNINLGASVTHNSQIKYKYTDGQLTAAGFTAADASHLRLAFYDTTQAKWNFPPSGSVDVNAKIVFQSTSSFSQWGVYYSANKATSLQVQVFSIVALMTLLGFLI